MAKRTRKTRTWPKRQGRQGHGQKDKEDKDMAKRTSKTRMTRTRAAAQQVQGQRRQRHLRARARGCALQLQGLRRRRQGRARAAVQRVQRLRRRQHLRARAGAPRPACARTAAARGPRRMRRRRQRPRSALRPHCGERDGSASANGCASGGVCRVCTFVIFCKYLITRFSTKARAEEGERGAHPLGGLSYLSRVHIACSNSGGRVPGVCTQATALGSQRSGERRTRPPGLAARAHRAPPPPRTALPARRGR
jgi:hypothetical protein